MTLRQTISVFSLVLLPFASAACGRHARGHHGYGMMMAHRGGMRGMHSMHRGMGGGDPVAQLLDHQAPLKLTSAQVNSLISIDEKLIADNKPLRDRLMALRPPMGGDRGKKPDSASVAARIPQRDSAAAVVQQMRENRWRAMNAAYGQLTEEQMSAVGRAGGGGGRPGGLRGGFGGRGGPDGGMRDGGQGTGRTGGGRPRGGGPGGPPSGSSGDQE